MTSRQRTARPKDPAPTGSSDVLGAAEKITASLLVQIRDARRGQAGQDPGAVLRGLDATRQGLSALTSLAEALDATRAGLAEAAERQFLELDATLRLACQERGWRLDGQWPTFYVERALEVQFSERERTVVVAGKRLDTCSVNAVSLALEPLVATLLPKGFSARTFLSQLAAAYHDCRGGRTQVPVFEVYRWFIIRSQRQQFWRDARASMFTPVTADQFRARLTRALEERATETTDGRALRLLPPLDPKDAMFVYQPAEQRFGFVGRLEFVQPPEVTA